MEAMIGAAECTSLAGVVISTLVLVGLLLSTIWTLWRAFKKDGDK